MQIIGIDAHNLEGRRTGVGRYLENLLREWARMTEAQNARFILYFKKEIPNDVFLKSPIFKCKKSPVGRFLFYFFLWLPYRARRDRVRLTLFPGYMVPPTYRRKSIVVLHDVAFERFPRLFPFHHRLFYRLFGKYGARASKAVITVSEFSKKEIIYCYKIRPDKIYITPLGIDPKFLQKSPSRSRTSGGGLLEGDYVLYVGQIFNRRHVPEAMQAFAKIAWEFPNLQFLVAGINRTKPFQDIDTLADDINKRLGREAVLRTDYIGSNLPAVYRGAKAGFYLSDYEGFGLPPLEFLACGTPVLAPNTTALRHTLGGRQVIISNPTDVDEIADKLRATLLNKELQATIKREGPKYAQQFSWKKCAEKTLEILLTTNY